jgi:hypothetical protein
MIVVDFDDSVVEEKGAKLACKNEMTKSGFYDRTERAYDGTYAAYDGKKPLPVSYARSLAGTPKERVKHSSSARAELRKGAYSRATLLGLRSLIW